MHASSKAARTHKKKAWPQSFWNWTSDGSLEQKNYLLICFHWFLSGDEAKIMFKLMFPYPMIKWTQLSTKKGPMYWLCFETVRKISLQCNLTFDWNWSRLIVHQRSSPPGIHYLGQLHENSLLRVALDQITEGQLQFTRLEQHFDTVLIGQPDQRR